MTAEYLAAVSDRASECSRCPRGTVRCLHIDGVSEWVAMVDRDQVEACEGACRERISTLPRYFVAVPCDVGSSKACAGGCRTHFSQRPESHHDTDSYAEAEERFVALCAELAGGTR